MKAQTSSFVGLVSTCVYLRYCAYVINTKNHVLAHILVIHTSYAKYRQGWGRGGGWWVGPDNVFFLLFVVFNVFHRGPYGSPSRSTAGPIAS